MRLSRIGVGLGYGSRPHGSGTTPADFLVTNDAEFATANTTATAGQIIQLQDSGTFTNLTLTNATGITVRGQTSGVPTLRTLTVNGAQNATVTGLKIQPSSAVAAGTKLVDLRGNLDGFVFEDYYVRYGDPWNGFADFDPTVTDTGRMGTNGAWGATNPYSTDLPIGIGSGGSGATLPSGSFTIRNGTVLDVASGIKFSYGTTVANATPKINGNVVGRCYTDCISFVVSSTSPAIAGLEICGNEIFDPFSQPQDNNNPHSDLIQFSIPTTWPYPAQGWIIAGNIAWFSPGSRGAGQRIFSNGSDTGYPIVAPVVVDNVMLSRVTTHGISLGSGDPEGVAWAYVYRNMTLANPVENVLRQNELFTNALTGVPPSVVATTQLYALNSPAYGNVPNFIAYNTSEGYTSYASDRLVGNITTGLGTTAAAYATWLDTDTTPEWNAITSADAALAALTLKTAYAANRPMTVGESAETFRNRWAVPSNRPWSSLPSWTGWVDLTGVTVSTVQTSEWAYVHAGQPGATRAISITGGEYRIADDRSGTNATAWTSSAGNVTSGKFLQVRQTASGSGSTATTVTVTIGSESVDWSVTTASSAAYPIVSLEGTTPDLFRVSGASNLGSDGTLGTAAVMRFKMSAAPATNRNIFVPSAGSGAVMLTVMTTGALRLTLYNSANAIFARLETTANLCDGSYHDILFSWDTSDTTAATGSSVYLDGSSNRNTPTWPASSTNVGYSVNKTSYQFGMPAVDTFEVGAFYLNSAARVDITNSTNRAKFNADQIATTGTGPTGSQPVVFLVGTAGQSGGWNDAAGINRGSGSKFIKVGSTAAVDVSGSTWV